MSEGLNEARQTPVKAPPKRSRHRAARLKILFDAGPAVHQSAGLARYTESLASALWRHCRDTVDLNLFYNRHSGHQLPASLSPIPARAFSLGQYPWRLGVLACQLLRAPVVDRKLGAGGTYHATEHLLPWTARPSVMTVHDLIFERYPQHHTLANRTFLRVAMPLFVRRAGAIIAVSRHTKQDLLELYGTPAHKVFVVEEGIEEQFRPALEEEVRQVKERHGIRRPYLLMVGTLEPRKNHKLAFEALARLKAEGFSHCLVVAGGGGWLFDDVQRKVEQLQLVEDVIFAGRVPDEDLPALYSGADCFLMPSLYEGFGIPVLEAMACGTPVVCSKVSSLPEVGGPAARYIESLTGEGLAEAVLDVLSNPQMAEQMRIGGLNRAARFRWQEAAMQTVDVYNAVAGGRH
ncbi:MAG: glycosyltransferase family 1 protein [Caldilineaceae bacterium]|nr:glycosyltransferase family 1 protein [Caldilineaceae bacterium]